MAQPLILNGISKLATIWFSDNQRAVATSIASLANPIGCIIGYGAAPFFVTDEDANNID